MKDDLHHVIQFGMFDHGDEEDSGSEWVSDVDEFGPTGPANHVADTRRNIEMSNFIPTGKNEGRN